MNMQALQNSSRGSTLRGVVLSSSALLLCLPLCLLLLPFDIRVSAETLSRGAKSAEDVEESDSQLYDELKVFTDVLSIVRKDYVRNVKSKEIVEGAIKGMLTTLDPHSGYLDSDFYQDLQAQTKGEFGGLGLEITVKDGLLVVVSPMEGSPAAKAGVRPGDAIVKIGGEFTKEFSLVDAVKRLRGPKGSSIQLSLMRKGAADLVDVMVIRDNITVRSVKGRYLGDGFGYARLSQFVDKTADDLTALLAKLNRDADGGLKGLILDLRNNPGGILNQAVRVSDTFLNEGLIVYTDGRIEAQKQKFYATSKNTEPNYPLIVLVNGGSASASEIVAGALKEHGRALIVGTQTFGKGTVQTITPLKNGGALTLTTALYYTKSGRSIQALGVTPDVTVEAPVVPSQPEIEQQEGSSRLTIRERDLPGAIQNPNGIKENGSTPLERINKTPKVKQEEDSLNIETSDLNLILQKDVQLQKALDLLKDFHVVKAIGASDVNATS